ncbi:MAG: SPOR domain-containing protein [candidate division KSB1 bacterium]|nr:SPOR domain-containing protein [candidate division KSB1 bacterium]MDZ7364982.1 SPOR domain-containing protein [candidate division KSB1 bacterium]MDZ7403377.1 SPOR domain-containing protein [candidate division KSB1 bacterium]
MAVFCGCTLKSEDQPPSNRADAPATDRDTRTDRSDAGQQPPPGQSRPPRGEVKSNEYTVQVGLFKRMEEADQRAYELRARRINNFVQQTGTQWRVCVGRYYSEGRAARMANQLKAMGFTEATVIAPGK